MGLFSGFGNADATNKTPWFEIGEYKVKIAAVKTVDSRQANNKTWVIVECEITESTCDKLPVGTMASQRIDMTQKMAFSNIKGFLAAAIGCPSDDKDVINSEIEKQFSEIIGRPVGVEDAAEFMVSDANPLEGIELGLSCFGTKTKAGGDFTVHRWYPLA